MKGWPKFYMKPSQVEFLTGAGVHPNLTIGLTVTPIEDDQPLQDLVLTVHHCFMRTLMNTTAFKIIENHLGAVILKRQQAAVIQQ